MQKIYLISLFFLSSLLAVAQTQVRNEPRHHNVFENKYIRILDVFIPPHDTTQFHIHNTPSVFTTFTSTAISAQLLGGQPVKSISVAGNILYDTLLIPRIHRVWNEASSWFHVMDVELTAGKPGSSEPPLQNPSLQLLFNEPLANGYRLQLQPSSHLRLPATATGYLLLSLGEAIVDYRVNNSIQHRIMKSGHYIWIESGKVSFVSSAKNSPVAFLLLQLK